MEHTGSSSSLSDISSATYKQWVEVKESLTQNNRQMEQVIKMNHKQVMSTNQANNNLLKVIARGLGVEDAITDK